VTRLWQRGCHAARLADSPGFRINWGCDTFRHRGSHLSRWIWSRRRRLGEAIAADYASRPPSSANTGDFYEL